MNIGEVGTRARAALPKVLPHVPVTVIVVTAVSAYLAVNEIRFLEVFAPTVLNPAFYTVNMLFHQDWAHFAGNMRLWIPFSLVLTWLTSDRHLLGLVVTVNFLESLVNMPVEGGTVGMSSVVFGVVAASLVRSTDYAMENASLETVQTAVAGMLLPGLVGFFLIMGLAGPRNIADFGHFLGFLFGGAIEAIYVLGDRESEASGRDVPKRVGR